MTFITQFFYICSEQRREFQICGISSLCKLWICGLQPHVRERPLEIHDNCKGFTYSLRFTDGVFGSFPKTFAMEIFEELMPYYLLAV